MNVLFPCCERNSGPALFHIQSVRDPHNPSLDCELGNLRFVSVNCVKSFGGYDSPLLFPVYAHQQSGYDLSRERDAEDLMVFPMGDHPQIVQHRPEKNNNFCILICELMIGDDSRLHTRLDQISKDLQTNVRDYGEMNSAVIWKSKPPDRISVYAIPETLKIFVTVDTVKNCFEFLVRIVRQVNRYSTHRQLASSR